MNKQLYSGKAYEKYDDDIATTTTERLPYGSMQRWVNDCFNNHEKITIRKHGVL